MSNDEKYKSQSRDILKRMCASKIRTTMIGALAAIESALGNRMESDFELKRLYEDIRKEILDKGNDQIREMELELDNYEVKWLRYRMQFVVKKSQLQTVNVEG